MIFRLNAKGESASTMIMWIGSILAVLIIIIWVNQNLKPMQVNTFVINDDLEKMQLEISNACTSFFYNRSFNPLVQKGLMRIDGSEICINSSEILRCKRSVCDSKIHIAFNITDIKHISIIRHENGTIEIEPIR